MKTLFKNIKELIQVRTTPLSFVAGLEMKMLPTIKNAFLLVEKGVISDFGSMDDCPTFALDETVDASGKMILPSWCDSHTHIVYAGNREGEFVDRINGLTYEEIANRGLIALESIPEAGFFGRSWDGMSMWFGGLFGDD